MLYKNSLWLPFSCYSPSSTLSYFLKNWNGLGDKFAISLINMRLHLLPKSNVLLFSVSMLLKGGTLWNWCENCYDNKAFNNGFMHELAHSGYKKLYLIRSKLANTMKDWQLHMLRGILVAILSWFLILCDNLETVCHVGKMKEPWNWSVRLKKMKQRLKYFRQSETPISSSLFSKLAWLLEDSPEEPRKLLILA